MNKAKFDVYLDASFCTVDVVMCTWNSNKPWFERCLKSIKKEIPVHCFILVDRFSNDNTLDVVKRIFPSARIIQTKSNLAQQRRLGIQMVDTDWFLFSDDDIEFKENWYNKIVSKVSANVKAINGVAIPTNESLEKFFLIRMGDGLMKSRKSVASKENPNAMRGLAGNTLIQTSIVKDWAPPNYLSAYEDHLLLRHVVSKGFKWISPKDAQVKHHGAFTCRSEYKKGKWNGAGARLTKASTLIGLLKVMLYAILTGAYASIKIRNPYTILILASMQTGYIIGYLDWNKYVDAYFLRY